LAKIFAFRDLRADK